LKERKKVTGTSREGLVRARRRGVKQIERAEKKEGASSSSQLSNRIRREKRCVT